MVTSFPVAGVTGKSKCQPFVGTKGQVLLVELFDNEIPDVPL